MKAQAEMQIKKQDADTKAMEAQARAQKMQADTALEAQQFEANQAMHEQRMGLDVSKFHVQTGLEERAMGAKTDEAIARERLQLIDLAQNLAVHPESAPVVAPLVRPAFQAVTERELEERARRGNLPPLPGLGGALPQ
jgi:mannitol-specific phosphotransferase system IIBC component